MKEKSEYYVVFEGTGQPGGSHKGVRRWSAFESREDFVREWENSDSSDLVLDEGVSREKAIKLCSEVSVRALVKAAHAEARRPDGRTDLDILDLKLATIRRFFPNEIERVLREN